MEEKISNLRQELASLDEKLQDSSIFASAEYPKIAKRQKYLQDTIGYFDSLVTNQKKIDEAANLADGDDPELASLARAEIEELTAENSQLNS